MSASRGDAANGVEGVFGVWVPVAERLPDHGRKVLACYVGVYESRVVDFWRDAGGGAHFGYPESSPATHWMELPCPPNDRDVPTSGTSGGTKS